MTTPAAVEVLRSAPTSARWFDRIVAAVGLVVASPVLAVAAAAIWLSDRSPILYRAVRVGVGGTPFAMYKLRTMRVGGAGGSRITGGDDPRVFAAGRWLRRLKLDEIPQLLNVARGEMALVGPRPEDPMVVERWYTPSMQETFEVLPGVTSPGTIRYSRDGDEEAIPAGPSAERYYAEHLLPPKIALDLAYVRHRNAWYDACLLMRTGLSLFGAGARLFGRQERSEQAEAGPIEATIRQEVYELLGIETRGVS